MTLEAAIQENTAAIRELIAAFAKGVPTTAAQVAAVVAEAPKTEKSKKETAQATVASNGASSTPTPSTSAEAAAQSPAAEASPSATSAAASVSYEDVKHAIVKLSGAKGRDAVVSLLKDFGAGKGPDLKPEQFADFVTKATQLVAA